MKRCPQCIREYDPTMMLCFDDGAELLYDPASMDQLIRPAAVFSRSVWDGLRDDQRFATRIDKVEQTYCSLY